MIRTETFTPAPPPLPPHAANPKRRTATTDTRTTTLRIIARASPGSGRLLEESKDAGTRPLPHARRERRAALHPRGRTARGAPRREPLRRARRRGRDGEDAARTRARDARAAARLGGSLGRVQRGRASAPVPPARRGARQLPVRPGRRTARGLARRRAARAGAAEAPALRGRSRTARDPGTRARPAARRRGHPLGRLGDARAARPPRP